MDDVARTSLSVHFLSKPTVLWVNKNVCVFHLLLTTNNFCFAQDTLDIISLIDDGFSESQIRQLSAHALQQQTRVALFAVFDAAVFITPTSPFRQFSELDGLEWQFRTILKQQISYGRIQV